MGFKRVTPGVTVREVDVSFVMPPEPTVSFDVIDDRTIEIRNWPWWYSTRVANKVNDWMDAHTENGRSLIVDDRIIFDKPEELTMFVLAWSGK